MVILKNLLINHLKMKNVYNIILILPLLFFSSCGSVRMNKLFENPQDYYFLSEIELEWDGKRPTQRFKKEIKVDEPFVDRDGYILTLKKTENDSIFEIVVRIDRNIYDPPYFMDEEHLRDRY